MNELRAVCCDDNPRWLQEAERLLQAYAQEAGLALWLSSYEDGASMLRGCHMPPDVLFCDIELAGGLSGIDLVHTVSAKWPRCQIVYVTNYLRYAPDVYVTEHLWFVLKDRFGERLPEIMDKLARKMDDDGRALAVQTSEHELLSIPSTAIVGMERRGRATIVTLADGASHQIPDKLPELLARLPERSFARCHGSFVVGLAHVRLVRRDSIVLDAGMEVPLSRRFARGFRERYLTWADDHAL